MCENYCPPGAAACCRHARHAAGGCQQHPALPEPAAEEELGWPGGGPVHAGVCEQGGHLKGAC